MNFDVFIESRNGLIAFGNELGDILKGSVRPKPWILTFGANADSGKSLLALAIDQSFRRDFYPPVIPTDFSADSLLSDPQTNSVGFHNFCRIIQPERDRFDNKLAELESKYPNAKVLIACNLERDYIKDFNYAALGLQSDRLDINIHFYGQRRSFERQLRLTAENPYLCSELQKLKSSVPRPPA